MAPVRLVGALVVVTVLSVIASTPGPARAGASLAVPGYGTLDDEKAYYRARGWAWTPDQEPTGPPKPGRSYYITGVDVHGDTEADDLWQNLLMWRRTGNQEYFDLAAQWARYFRDEYRTGGLQYDLAEYGADHMWGWGLVDWWEITHDQAALAEAIRLAAISESLYGSRTADIYGTTGLRGIARHLLLVMRVAEATEDPRWTRLRDHLADLLMHTRMWDATWGTYLWPRPITSDLTIPKTVSPIHFGFASWALYRYYELTGNPEAREKVIAMARFAQRYGLHPVKQYAGNYVAVDYPGPGQVFYGRWDDGANFLETGHTVAFIDTLIRGYRLTGDRALLDRAYYHWERASKARYGDAVYRAPDNQVGRFVNRYFLSDTPFYLENGDLSYAALLFADLGGGDPPGDPPPGVGTFADVPLDHFAAPWIEALAAAGVTGGCATNPLRFCPEAFVTREQMAVFLLKARHDAAYTPPACTHAPFGDVPCETPFAAWIADLVAHGTTAGCGGGDYCPTAPVTREQMAVFLLKILEGAEFVPAACTTEDFADVPCSSPFAPWVQELVRRGITVGCAAGRYCPTDPITRGQMAVFVVKTFGLPM